MTPTTAPAICMVAAITIVSAEPSSVAITPPMAEPSAKDQTFSPTAVVNTCP